MKSHTLTEINAPLQPSESSVHGSVFFNVGGALCLIIAFIAGIAG